MLKDTGTDTARIPVKDFGGGNTMPENTNDFKENQSAYMKDNPGKDINDRPLQNPGRVTASFVLGIASIVLCVAPFMLIAAIVGLLLEKESERMGYYYLQKPAKVLCIIGIVLCSIAIAAIITVIFVLGIISR